ncbi:MAG TPA: hypothetical protein VGF48_12065 [Thermoanaerobaculia bacterium]|jgi:hypothetical protein
MMRRVSLSSFIAGVALLPVAVLFLGRALAGPRVNSLAAAWGAGRAISMLAAALLLVSVVTSFLTPPERTRRIWWAVPATVTLVVTVLFGWFLFSV